MSETTAIRLTTKGGERDREIDALRTANASIVIHPTLYFDECVFERLGGWSVSHLPSGLSILAGLPNQDVAATVAAYLNDTGVDWSLDFDAMQKETPEHVRVKIRKIKDAKERCELAMMWLLEAAGVNGFFELEDDDALPAAVTVN